MPPALASLVCLLALMCFACGGDDVASRPIDASFPDTGFGGRDGGPGVDASRMDAGAAMDSGAESDGGPPDAFFIDGGPPPTVSWAKGWDGFELTSLAVDRADHVYVGGRGYADLDLGGGPLASVGGYDLMLASFTADGTHRWSRSYGSTGPDALSAVAVDSADRVLIGGRLQDMANLGGGSLSDGALVASYAQDGTHGWSLVFGTGASDRAADLAVDSSDHVRVVGNRGAAGLTHQVLLSYDAAGGLGWERVLRASGSSLRPAIFGMAVAGDGASVVGGTFTGLVDFGSGPVMARAGDAFIASYGADGSFQALRTFGGESGDRVADVAVDSSGNVSVVGKVVGTVDVGGGEVSLRLSKGLVASYDAGLNYRWARLLNGNTNLTHVAVDLEGNVYVAGIFDLPLLTPVGEATPIDERGDIFVMSYAADGTPRWLWTVGSPENDRPTALAVDSVGRVYVGGEVRGTADFGGTMLTEVAFLAQLVPP